MIEARNLMKVYKPKKGVPVHALNDVSVKLPDKGMVFILGKSGSGKSTLLNVLGGLDNVNSGEIIIKGVSAKDFKQAHYDSYRNTYVGFIFQEYNVLEEFTVGANVALAIELQGRKPTNEEINKILKEVDLEGYGNRKPNELSGGQKQRVAIARALVKNPEIIMADEPTGALDSTTGRQVFDTLKSLSKDKLVLIVSHDREFSELYADRIIELADGKIISDVEKVGDTDPVADHEEEKALTYSGNEIEIKKGYVLTQADLKAINEYIANLSDDAKMVIKGEVRPDYVKRERGEFAPTDESRIYIRKDNNFKLIKSKLSLKNAFKIGASGLKHKKFRLVLTIFLSFIAFALFGLADTIASYDNVGTAISSLIDSNIDYASFQKEATINDYSRGQLLSDADIDKINQALGIDAKGVYSSSSYWGSTISFDNHISVDHLTDLSSTELDDLKNKLENLYVDGFVGFAEVTASDINRYGYQITGTLPQSGKKEIAISKYIYEIFKEAGFTYTTNSDGAYTQMVKEITTPEDLIGETISLGTYGDYTITAVIDTGFDVTRYNLLLDRNPDTATAILQMALMQELEYIKDYSMNCVAFVAPGTIKVIQESSNEIGKQWMDANIEITTRPANYNGNDWGSFPYIYVNRIARLSDVSSTIKWLNGEKTSLANGEFILPFSVVMDHVNVDDGENNYNSFESLTGFELTVYNRMQVGYSPVQVSSVMSALENYEKLAAYKYALQAETDDVILQYLKDFIVANEIIGEYDDISNYSKETIIDWYVANSQLDPANEARAEAYLEDLYARYGLEGKIIDLKKHDLYAEVTYNGETYPTTRRFVSLNDFRYNYQYTILQYYAYTHFEDAKAYYLELNPNAVFTPIYDPDSDKIFAQFHNIINKFEDSFYDGEFYRQNLKAEFSELVAENTYEFFKDYIDLEGFKLQIYMYYPFDESYEYDFNLVGVSLSGGSYFVASEEVYSKVLAGNPDGIYNFAVAPMPENRSGVASIVEFTQKSFPNDIGADISFILKNSVTYELEMIDDVLEILGQVFLYVGLALAVFASLMLSNFIATSVSMKKQEIGILRAIGSRSNDVFRIFFAEAFIIAMINFTLAIVTTGVVATVINSILREDVGILITILSFGVRQIGLLLAISLFVAAASTFLPVKKIASKKPIDAIRKR